MFQRTISQPAVMLTIVLLISFSGCTNNNQTGPTTSSPVSSPAASPAATTTNSSAPRAKLNINTASGPELLTTIPNFSNRMVHEFEEYRPYRSVQQFRREIGKYVDAATIAEYEKYIYVPIDPNQSDAQTLMQIPGLERSEAESLVAGRPYASADVFLTKLSEMVSDADVQIARSYLNQQ